MSDQKIAVLDVAPAHEDFRDQFIAGLTRKPRILPSKFFYDEAGSALFNQICELPEYYITRTEMRILREHGAEIAKTFGPGVELIGLGTGAGTKTRLLLKHLDSPTAYIPVDISREQLTQSTLRFSRIFPALEILPVCADYLEDFELPTPLRRPKRKIIYFPGSTLGNLQPDAAAKFLKKIREMAERGGGALIAADLKKSKAILDRAYNDRAGITARFNHNILARANRELDANFDLAKWKHLAFYNEDVGRIEMHLISATAQDVRINGHVFSFAAGEHIITEFSYKYSPADLIHLGDTAGLHFRHLWTDPEKLFGLFFFEAGR